MTLRTRFILPLALGASLALTAVPGSAATAEPATPEAKATPAAKPGRTIDIAEAQARAEKSFTAADQDGDGKISRDEFATMKHPGFHERRSLGDAWMGGPGMRGRDIDAPRMGAGMGRGMPSAEERAAFHKELFAALDSDGNGQLSEAEFERQHEATQEVFRKRAFDGLDANADGVLTPDEMPSPVARLERADANKDGKVTSEEMRAARRPGAGPTKAQ